MTKKYPQPSDKTLLKKIQDRIRWDIRVSNADISITVKNGHVTLHGFFDQHYRHAAALHSIETTEGVFSFSDQSRVLGDYFRTDRDLEKLINKQVLAQPLMAGEWIDVQINNGVAKIEGRVYRTKLKALASRATWELSGIKDCINKIEIDAPPVSSQGACIEFRPTTESLVELLSAQAYLAAS